MTNDREEIWEHNSRSRKSDFHITLHFHFSPYTMSLNIDMKVILSLKCSGSHFVLSWIFESVWGGQRCRSHHLAWVHAFSQFVAKSKLEDLCVVYFSDEILRFLAEFIDLFRLLKSWRKDSSFGWFSYFSINCLIVSLRCVSCCSFAGRDPPVILYSAVLLPVSQVLFDFWLVIRFFFIFFRWFFIDRFSSSSSVFLVWFILLPRIPFSRCKQLLVWRRGRSHAT